MDKYEIIFSGQMLPGSDPQQVRQGVQRLFNASEQLLDQFFSGRQVVVKRDMDQATAEKYCHAFNQVGALVELVVTEQSAEIPQAPAQAEPATAAASPSADIAPRDEYMAAFSHIQAPDFGLAVAGADLLDHKEPVVVPDIDLSAISLAPAGSDLEQLPGIPPFPTPDISHLAVVDED